MTDYNEHHQLRLFAALLYGDTVSTHRSMLSPALFVSPEARANVQVFLACYDTIGRTPDHDTLRAELARRFKGSESVVQFFQRAISVNRDEAEKIYAPQLANLIRLAHMQKCAVEALEACNKGDVEAAEAAMRDSGVAMDAHERVDVTEVDDLDERYAEGRDAFGRDRKFYTGYKKFDATVGGALAAKEVHLVVGPSGFGKTRLAQNFVVRWALGGAKVEYISLELGSDILRTRSEIMMTGMTADELKTDEGKALVRSRYREMKSNGGTIWWTKFLPDSMTVSQIGAFLQGQPQKADIVIVDYLDLLITEEVTKSNNYWVNQGKMVSRLHKFAEHLDQLFLVLDQPKGGDVEGLDSYEQIGGAKSKIHALDSLWMMDLKETTYNNDGVFHLNNKKNRHGARGVRVKMQYDHRGTGLRVSESV